MTTNNGGELPEEGKSFDKEKANEVEQGEKLSVRITGPITEKPWQGPLPSAEDLAAYAEISPELPERIMRLAEMNYKNQLEIQAKLAESNRQAYVAGTVVMGLLLVLTLIIVFVLLNGGADIGALAISLLPGVAAILSAIPVIHTLRLRRRKANGGSSDENVPGAAVGGDGE